MKDSVKFAQLINVFNPEDTTPPDINYANNSDCDIIALKFNIDKIEDIKKSTEALKKLLPQISKQLMIYGTTDDEIDKILLPELVKILDRKHCIISYANENTYKNIVPSVIEGEHYLVLKTPIDINLAKELNILSVDMGLDLDKIVMNTDIGGLGYGYEYGYSIMEKIKQEVCNGDEYLNLPIISDVSIESLKTKEAKSSDFSKSWGELNKRTQMIELAACAGILSAGANIITLTYPENISILKGMV